MKFKKEVWITVLVLLLAVGLTYASSVAVDNISTNSGQASSFTFSHTVGSNNNRMLIVGVTLDDPGTSKEVSGVTYNGTNMTQIANEYDSGIGTVRIHVFRLLNPPSGTHDVVVTLEQENKAGIGAINYYNVDQSNSTGPIQTNSFEGTSSSIDVSSGSGDIVMDIIGGDKRVSNNSWGPGPGQTEQWAVAREAGKESGSSTEPGNITTTMNWTTESGRFLHLAFNINSAENSAPEISSVSLTTTDPSTNYTAENLTGTVSASDTEGDNITYIYNWYKNNVLNATTLIEEGLVSYWSLNNDSLDYSGNNNCTTYNGASLNPEGKIRSSFEFDGTDDYLNCENDHSLNLQDTFTISAWVNLDTTAPAHSYHSSIVDRCGNNQDGYWFYVGNNGKPGLLTFTSGSYDVVGSSSAISAGKWVHLAAVYERAAANEIKIYIDGELDKEGSVSVQAGSSNNNVIIGDRSSLHRLDGKIDEILIYNKTLSASDIKQLYSGSRYGGNVMNSSQTSEGDEWMLGVKAADYNSWSPETNSSPVTINTDESRNIESSFVSPTPADNANISNNFTEINISITNADNLEQFKFNWNNTNHTFYDNNLLLMSNFDNSLAIGENSTYSVDISSYSHNGTLDNGAYYSSESKYGKSIYLDGTDDYLNIPDSSDLDFGTSDFTMMLWVKRVNSGTSGILSKGYFENEGYSWFFTGSDQLRIRADSDSIDTPNTAGETVTPSDGWTHITAVADRDGNLAFYKNGELSHTHDISSASSQNITAALPFRVGFIQRESAGTIFYSNMYADELKVYNRTLSAEEIKQHYYANLYKFNNSNFIFYTNQSNLENKTYNYSAYAIDNETTASTGTRTLIVGTTGNQSQQNQTNTTNTTNSTDYNITFLDNGITKTGYNYSDGNLNNVKFNETENSLQLSSGQTSGEFTSQIFDAGTSTQWNNISWISDTGAIPDNRAENPSIDLTGNVLLMHLDESSGTIQDTSGQGNDGTNYGASYSASGKFKTGLSFDGTDDYVSIGSDSRLAFGTGDFAISFWAKPTSIPSAGNYQWIIDKYSNGRFVVGLNGAQWRAHAGTSEDGGTAVNGQWDHIVSVRIGETMYLYENGVLVDSGSGHNNDIQAATVILGQRGDATNVAPFAGTVDELAIFNRSLSLSEVKALYKRGITKLNLTARTCDDSSCSGESWTNIQDESPQTLSLSDNQYFQYNVKFTTENSSYSPNFYNATITYGTESISEGNSGTYINDSSTKTRYSFFSGNLNKIYFNDSLDALKLNSSTSGNFTSQIFTGAENASWNNISWTAKAGELNSNKKDNVLLLHLNEGSGTLKDSSSYNNHASNNGASYSAQGKLNNALEFGTDDYIKINDSSSLYNPDGFSVSAWIKDTGTSNIMIDLISKYENLEEEWYIAADKSNNGMLRFFLYGEGGNLRRDASSSDLFDGEWHLLTTTWNGSSGDESINIYLDGIEIDDSGADTGFTSLYNKNSSILIGKNTALNNQDLVGYVDEVSIWNKTLSQSEIQDIYDRGFTNINFSVRTCDDSSCSGETLTDITDQSPQTLNLQNNTYFQYKAEFTAENLSFNPELYNVTVSYTPSQPPATSGTITITYPTQYILFQRDTDNTSDIEIQGTYTGNPETIEARFNNGNWTSIDSSPSGNSFSANLTDQPIGQGSLEVRFKYNNSVTDSISDIAVGDIYAMAGQSNAEMRGYNSQTLNSSNQYIATVYREDDAWRISNDPVDTGTSIGSSWVHLADLIIQEGNIPMAYVAAASGGSAITQWQKGGSYYNNLVAQIGEATNGKNKIKALLFFQGERDSSTTGTGCNGDYTCYRTNLAQMASDFMSDINAGGVVVGQTHFQPSGNRTTNDNIRKAQQDLWDEDSNILYGAITYDIGPLPDNLHFKTDTELRKKAERWWAALNYHFYNQTYGRAPRLTNASFESGTNKLTLIFNTTQPLLAGSGTEGWRIDNNGDILTDANIVSTNVAGTNQIELILDTQISEGSTISLASYNDGDGKNVPYADYKYNIPAQMIFSYPINISTLLIEYKNPTPENNAAINTTYFTVNVSIINGADVEELTFNWNQTNYTFYNSGGLLAMNFDNESGLEENSTYAVDMSPQQNNGRIHGSPELIDGVYDNTYNFDGIDDYINIPNHESLNLGTSDFTLETWINLDSTGKNGILAKTHPTDTIDSSNGYAFYVDENNKLAFKAQSYAINAQSTGNITPSDGWTHVVVVADRDENITFYKNGKNIGSTDISAESGISITSTYDLRVGVLRNAFDEFLNGSIDELLMFNQTIDQDRIMRHYYTNLYKHSPSSWTLVYKEQNLTNGTYSFYARTKESSGNEYSTEERTVNVSIIIPDITPPSAVSNISKQSYNTTWIYWNWTNPSDPDLSEAIIYIDNLNVANTSNNYYNATGLNPDTVYTIRINTKDTEGNINYTNITDTASTSEGPDIYPPNIQSTSPSNSSSLSAGTTSTTIHLTTDEIAVCRYNTTNTNISWQNMTEINNTNSTEHNFTVTGLSNGNTYNYYFLCEDNESNVMASSYHLRFSISSSSGSGGSSGGGGGGGSSSSTKEQCRDGLDNDGDGLIDYPDDPGCTNPYDNDETDDTCSESWHCTEWSECINRTQTRECTDWFGCGTEELKPLEEKECAKGAEKDTEASIKEKESNFQLKEKQKISFEYKKETHWITVLKLEEDKAEIKIESDPIELKLHVKQAENIDLDSDGKPDIRIILNKIKDEKADITLKFIGSGIGAVTGQAIKVLPHKTANPYYLLPTILLLIIFIVLISTRKSHLSKNKKKMFTILHLTLMGLIMMLFISAITKNLAAGAFVANITGSNTILLPITIFAFILAGVSSVLMILERKRIEKYIKKQHKSKHKKVKKNRSKKDIIKDIKKIYII